MVTDLLTEVSPSQRTLFVPEMELCWNLNYVQPQYIHDFGLECIIDKLWHLSKKQSVLIKKKTTSEMSVASW